MNPKGEVGACGPLGPYSLVRKLQNWGGGGKTCPCPLGLWSSYPVHPKTSIFGACLLWGLSIWVQITYKAGDSDACHMGRQNIGKNWDCLLNPYLSVLAHTTP